MFHLLLIGQVTWFGVAMLVGMSQWRNFVQLEITYVPSWG